MKRVTANQYMSKYILLLHAIPPDYVFVRCVTCSKILQRNESGSHAGHFIPKGQGGGSGVYYDERNIHPQCHNCNVWLEGNRIEYYNFMLKRYGEAVIEELRLKDRLPRPNSITEYGIYYREAFKELKKNRGLKK